jgi:hypothetical protein
MTPRIQGCLLLALAPACAHQHLDRNAPGIVDVRAPPRDPKLRAVEDPVDPGERMLVFGYGALAGGGAAFGGAEDETRGFAGGGAELSSYYGESPRSHYDDDFFIYPLERFGINLGFTALSTEGDPIGPAYAEAQYGLEAVNLAAGWAWDPDDAAHGPQATLSFGFLYLRAQHLSELGTQVGAGIVLKGNYALVWSR